MRVFDGEINVDYNQLYVVHDDHHDGDLAGGFRGQANGLCGAATPGVLYLLTGLHTGDVPVAVDLLDGPPPVEPDRDEVVEASFEVCGTVRLAGWGFVAPEIPFPVPGSCRVRWSARGFEAGQDVDCPGPGEHAPDDYLLQFWPGPPAPDAILRRTSADTQHRHDYAAGLDPTR